MNKIKATIAAAAIMLCATAGAQETESAYFVKGYLNRHDMNPALANDYSYISVPLLGNFNLDVNGTLGLKDLLYNVNGKTVTYLNPNVSTGDVLGNINDENKFGANVKLQILGFGFKAFGGYNTVGINARVNTALTLPGAIIEATKEGLTNQTYDFSNMSLSANSYAEIAFGHSRQIGENLSVGAKAKVLIGLAGADLQVNKAQLSLGEDRYTAVVDADMYVNTKKAVFKHDKNETTGREYVSGVDEAGVGVNGFGVAVDLGAVYKLDDWAFSASVTDLGVLKYSNSLHASTNGERTFDTNKYVFNVDDSAPNSFGNEIDRLTDGLGELYQLSDKGSADGQKVSLGTTLRVGAEYTMPFYRGLSLGVLGTARTGNCSWSEVRVAANLTPVKCLSASVSAATGTYGFGFGGVLALNTRGFNMFVAMDRVLGEVSKQFIPLNSNASVSLGVNVPF